MSARLLNDRQMQEFIRNGFIGVQTALPADFHKHVFDKTGDVFEKEGNPGNNLLARIPEVQKVFDDPSVHGALTSVLGPSYFMEPHRHCHFRPPGGGGQRPHKDGFTRKRHHTRWILAMYYPQDTTVEMGATGIKPGTQYHNSMLGAEDEPGTPMPCDAGTVIICNYDLWHHGNENSSDKNRFMMKVLFTRMDEPQAPSWDTQQPEWQADSTDEHPRLWSHLWAWHYGKGGDGSTLSDSTASAKDIAELMGALSDDAEVVALEAAYALGEAGSPAVPGLIETLRDGSAEPWYTSEEDGRYGSGIRAASAEASYALAAIGGAAVPGLVETLRDGELWTRVLAIETLGDIGPPAREAVPALIEVLDEESEPVRRYAAEALGTTSQSTSDAVPALVKALSDEEETVRLTASLALARIGSHAGEAVPALVGALEDENRYVLGHAVQALYRIGTPEASDALMSHLIKSRSCHITRPGSLY